MHNHDSVARLGRQNQPRTTNTTDKDVTMSVRMPGRFCAIVFASVIGMLIGDVGQPRAAEAQLLIAPVVTDQVLPFVQLDQPASFVESVWLANNFSNHAGATVHWSSGPFVHQSQAAHQVDCRISVRTIASAPLAHWSVVSDSDQTDVAAGENLARVSAESNGVGDASFGVSVDFLANDASRIASGNYELIVVATISAN